MSAGTGAVISFGDAKRRLREPEADDDGVTLDLWTFHQDLKALEARARELGLVMAPNLLGAAALALVEETDNKQ